MVATVVMLMVLQVVVVEVILEEKYPLEAWAHQIKEIEVDLAVKLVASHIMLEEVAVVLKQLVEMRPR